MYKHAAGLILDDSGPRRITHGVVAFRVGRDNQRRRRIYRRVWMDSTGPKAQRRWDGLAPVYGDAFLLRGSKIVDIRGSGELVREWVATRKGCNLGVHPITGTRYDSREGGYSSRDDAWFDSLKWPDRAADA